MLHDVSASAVDAKQDDVVATFFIDAVVVAHPNDTRL